MLPRNSTPPQNTAFSPALKRCDAGSLPPNRPPPCRSQVKSSLLGQLLRMKVKIMNSVVTTNSGPTKLCTVLST
ncbi:hypothetical protein D9M72_253830 [compost metagenome]